MSSRTNPAGSGEAVVLWSLIGLVAAVVFSVWGGLQLGSIFGANESVPANPFDALFGVLDGTVAWSTQATLGVVVIVVGLLLLAATVLWLRHRVGRRRTRVDRAAPEMGRGRDLAVLGEKESAATAARLGVAGTPGLPLGRAVVDGRWLYSGWEDQTVDIWGPRTGKTTSRAVPAILAAPGAVLVTSNKRDVVDATREPRAELGPAWVFDPQGIVDEQPSWWWNPLSYVTDETRADVLASVFAAAAREPGARTDAYFDSAARDLLAGLLLAASLDRRPITDVYLWLTDPTDAAPVDILAQHDYPLPAAGVRGVIDSPDRQRDGVYGTARQIVSFLTNRSAARWVTPPRSGGVAEFDPAEFVTGTGTLYSLSKEGRGSTGPLVVALTVAVTEAAEAHAKRSPQGRLPVPMVCVLDEAANICRWRELPNLYSHYGSRGIVMMTILQSWSQGVEVWGQEGMRKLWSSANIKVYGGGVSEVAFLDELSRLVGDHDVNTVSVSRSRQGRSTSHQTRKERKLDVSDLGELDRGRALVIASGVPPTLVATVPWWEGEHADAVQASIAAHEPQNTVEDALPNYGQLHRTSQEIT